ncbi:MAG: ATP-grasp domain-containing protein [Synergistaceae bacterium]|nr:ATP-grasp domain-containing protein [Synergistaceae bacterium]
MLKRLMILGGTRYIMPVIKAAHELGCYVITCDYLPNNYAHKYADEYCNVSILDKEATLKAAEKLKIDGITSFACDPGVVTAAYVADRLGIPSVGPYESVRILQNKGLFRKFLTDNGFNVPVSGSYTNPEEALAEAEKFHWPVIVKPTDSAGSRGVQKVDAPEGLREAAEYALSCSRGAGDFIIEDFIQQRGFSSDTDSFSVDGVMKFVSFNSQRFDRGAKNPYTPAAYSWPSSMTQENQNHLASELQRLVTLLNMGTTIYNIETREDMNGTPYIMECSPRGGGNRLAEVLEMATGLPLIEGVVRGAIGLPVEGIEQRPFRGCWAEVILHSDIPGVFESLWVDEEVEHAVVERSLWVEPGKKIGGFSSAGESIGQLILNFPNEAELNRVMNDIKRYVKVKVS